MTDAKPQPPEPGPQMRDHIAHSVVTAMTAALLESRHSRGQIDIIVHHQDLGRLDAVEVRQRATGAPLRFMKPSGLASQSS